MLGAPAVDHDLVFTTPEGDPLNPRCISQAFQTRRKRAKLPHIRLHDLRHGAATLALEGDVNLEPIDLYARHEIVSAERAAADTVAGLIDARLQSVSKEKSPRI